MKKKTKMNILYKIAFILMLVCIALLIAGGLTAYLFRRPVFSVVFTGSGVALAFIAIVLASLSSPKKEKDKSNEDNEIFDENKVDNG